MRSPEFAPIYRHGECDTCHGTFTLYAFEDDEEGDWVYCERCANVIKRNRRRKIQEAARAHYTGSLV